MEFLQPEEVGSGGTITPLLQLRKPRPRQPAYSVHSGQWGNQCGIPTPDSHARLLSAPGGSWLEAEWMELKADSDLPGEAALEGPGRSCPPPRGFPPCPRLDSRLGTTQTRRAAFHLADWGAGSQGCAEGVSRWAQAN